ncbi:hypothetical protein [Actinoplanes sp. NPDC049316]|uniref:hypothetical protein n=1 Tax=Actinoplanes sp. NPDC049316 TaxID=3154727 RepID=UPI00343DDE73
MAEHYEIRINGFLGPLLRTTFSEMQCRTVRSHSVIQGRLGEEDLLRLLQRLDQSGVRLLCVRTAQPG